MAPLRPVRRLLSRSTLAAALLLAPLAAWAATPSTPAHAQAGSLFINEVLFDPPGQDDQREYVELRGAPNFTVPNNTYLLVLEANNTGTGNNPGDVRNIFPLGGKATGANGYMVLLPNASVFSTTVNAAAAVYSNTVGVGFGNTGTSTIGHRADISTTTLSNTIANTSNAFFLIQTDGTFTPSLISDFDTNNDGTPELPQGVTVLDSIGVTDSEQPDFGYGAIVFRRNPATVVNPVNPTTGGNNVTIVEENTVQGPFTADYIGRVGDSTGSNANEWVASQDLGGSFPVLTLNNKYTLPANLINAKLDNIGSTNNAGINVGPITNCGAPITATAGTAFTRPLLASDPNSRVVSATLTLVSGVNSPPPSSTAITITNPIAATADGGTFTTTLSIPASTPTGSYTATVRFFNNETPQVSTACSIAIGVGQAPPPPAPIVPTCGSPVAAFRGSATIAPISATDADSAVISATLVSVAPSNAGITLGTVTPAGGDAGTLSAALNINSTITGTFTATLSFGNDETPPQTATCEVVINVSVPQIPVTLTGGPASGTAPIGLPLTLTANSSDSNVVSYTFRVTSNLTTTALTVPINNNPATTSFTPTIEGVYTVTATANTGVAATRVFTLTNGAPTAVASVRAAGFTTASTTTVTVPPTTTITLDGSASSDAASDLNLHLPLTYTWTQVAQTGVPTVVLSGNASEPTRTFVTPSVAARTTFTFQLVVADRFGKQSAPALITVVVDPNARIQRSIWLPIILLNPAAARS